jgi:hypothetical protein
MVYPLGGHGVISHKRAELWAPSNDPNLVAWFNAQNSASIKTDDAANRVSSWEDISGNGHHLFMTTAANQPRTGVSTYNGLNVIDADTLGMRLDQSGVTAFPIDSSGDHAAYGFFGDLTVNNARDSLWSFNAATTDYQFEASNATNFRMGINATGLGDDVGSDSGNHNGPSVYGVSFIWNATTGTKQAYTDGVPNDNGPKGYTGSKLNTAHELLLFINRFQAQDIQAFCLGFAVTDDSSDATREKYEGYFAHLAGTEANLPIGHPYKTNPPLV